MVSQCVEGIAAPPINNHQMHMRFGGSEVSEFTQKDCQSPLPLSPQLMEGEANCCHLLLHSLMAYSILPAQVFLLPTVASE